MFRRFASHAAGQQPEAPAFVYRSASSKITSCVSSPFDWTIRDPNWIIKLALAAGEAVAQKKTTVQSAMNMRSSFKQ